MLEFIKISATGNDFIVINNMKNTYSAENKLLWETLCERRKNIGADGVLLVESSEKYDFRMRYINSDGGEVGMCGNGGRAISLFYFNHINSSKHNLTFETMNGVYKSEICSDKSVKIQMTELSEVNDINISELFKSEHSLYLNTGVPHCVYHTPDIKTIDVISIGKKVRENKLFSNGTNVNFYSVIKENELSVRTYERGVENETLSCGTGITAVAIACRMFYKWNETIKISTRGGSLSVEFSNNEIYLIGDVDEVFKGTCSI